MSGLFSPDSKFSIFMTRVFDLIVLNLIFILFSIPVITIGANVTSIYYITLKMASGEDTYIVKTYFRAFKENFKKSTIVWLITAFIGIIIILDLYLVRVMNGVINGMFAVILNYVFIVMLVLYIFYLTYVFPLMAKFENTVKNSIKNALLISVLNFPYTLMMLCLTVGPALISIRVTQIFSYYVLYLFLFGFSVPAFFSSAIFAKKVFPKYIPAETDDAEDSDFEVLSDSEESPE